MENISEEQQEGSTGTKKTRIRLQEPEEELRNDLREMKRLLDSKTLREMTRAQLVMRKSAIGEKLLANEREDAENSTLQENETLKAQHTADQQTIADLKLVNADLTQRVSERVTEIVPDHEAREENEKLRTTEKETLGLLKFLTSSLGGNPDGKARLAVRVIQNFPASAQGFLPLIGCDYSTFMRGMRMSDQELMDILEKSSNEHGEMCVMARACLVTRDTQGVPKVPKIVTPEPMDTRSHAERVADAVAQTKREGLQGAWKSPILNITANPGPTDPPVPAPAKRDFHEAAFDALLPRDYRAEFEG
jgi:hypothetical protein